MQTIGERLEDARKKKGISIREAAEATKIRGDYLQKFESNQFDIGLTEIYTRGFLRTYANYLKIPADRLLNEYASLGRGEAKPRQPSREVYGRMDISVSSASDTSDRAAPPNEDAASAEPSRPQPRYPRASNNLPQGPAIDPAKLFKYAKIGGIVVGVVILFLIVRSVMHRSSAANSAAHAITATTIQPAAGPMLTLIALNTVHVQVTRKNPDKTDGEILYDGTLEKNQTQLVPRPGELYITANPSENLAMEMNGKRFTMNLGNGLRKGQLPAP
jgi:cytoskeleton protein RodZ